MLQADYLMNMNIFVYIDPIPYMTVKHFNLYNKSTVYCIGTNIYNNYVE